MATNIQTLPFPDDTSDIDDPTPTGIGQFEDTTYITSDIDNLPHNQLKANQNALKDSIDSIYTNKVETDDVTDAKTPLKIPVRDGDGKIKADVTGNADSATTLSAGADRDTVDGLKQPAFDNYGTSGGTVAQGNHLHDSRYFRLDVTTKMVFVSYPLPMGWVLDTTANDKTLIIQNSSTGIGDSAGSWNISGFNAAGGHSHSLGTSNYNIRYPQSTQASFYIARAEHKHSVSSEGNHTHTQDGTWRPAFKKSCIGVR